jgi:UDP-N-acetylmuramoylalanine--D-glutamate ligase
MDEIPERVLILGLGVSGESAAEWLSKKGAEVVVVDRASSADLVERSHRLEKNGIKVVLGCADSFPFELDFDLCVVSPGVPVDSVWVRTILEKGIKAISELELGWRYLKCPLLAITGSNGKSTLVKLCADALSLSGLRIAIAGNYGIPLTRVVEKSENLDRVVAEVSSFQLELVDRFNADVAALLNLNPNHLDRHRNFETYLLTKLRIFGTGREHHSNVSVICEEYLGEAITRTGISTGWVTFGVSESSDYRYVDSKVKWKDGNIDLSGTMFDNSVMGMTAACAVAAVRGCGVDASFVEKAGHEFKPLPHRMECVGEVNGIQFIDDSKATNLAAMAAGIKMCNRPVRLIAGGVLKEYDLFFVKNLLAQKVKKVYLIGSSQILMEKAWKEVVDCCCCDNMENAVRTAWSDACAGDVILLSPGCASFDQYRNFEERGEDFRVKVSKITSLYRKE